MRFVDPTNAAAFHKIFGHNQNKIVLISFLNATLDLRGEKQIRDLIHLHAPDARTLKELKGMALLVRARDGRGVKFIVEMQLEWRPGIEKRVPYYSAKAYATPIPTGEDYPNLNQVIFIGIMDFNIFQGESFLTSHLILNGETQRQDLQEIDFNFIELPKFTKPEAELETLLEKWVYFLKHARDLQFVPEGTDEEGLQQAYALAERQSWTPAEWDAYDSWGILWHDVRGALESVRQKEGAEAQQKGRAEGHEEGLEKGLSQGRVEGLQQAILLGLVSKFGAGAIELFAFVEQCGDQQSLQRACQGLWRAQTLEEFRRAYFPDT